MSFSKLGLIPPLLQAIADAGYTVPSPIQSQAIGPLLEGRDLMGISQTGTGKTAAFALPLLQRMHQSPQRPAKGRPRPIRTLVVTPTRELAAQVSESFQTYGSHLRLSCCSIYGGVGMGPQVSALARGVDTVVACPGRLLDLINQGHARLDQVEALVLDEADRMFDMGFLPDLKRIISRLPAKRQNLLFSATMPEAIRSLAESVLRDPVRLSVAPVSSAAETVSQGIFYVNKPNKLPLLQELARNPEIQRCLVFTRTKHGADKVVRKLSKDGVGAAAIHGNKSQGQRQRALEEFRSGKIRILVASDLASRGLDIDEVSHVINFDIPNEPETYVHRIGRTGRAGASGIAWSFCDDEEKKWLRDIEKMINKRLPALELPHLPAASEVPTSGSNQTPAAKGPAGRPPRRQGQGQGQNESQRDGQRRRQPRAGRNRR
ncbi:MAG: DEAD/DEAH box helicase [Planctomycetota bacterium]|nr:MAG: DEAD/DEAH box helicase [Planctomycetota bacterium]